MKETFKDIPGYEGLYAASDQGRIYSYPKLYGRRGQMTKGALMKPGLSPKGYRRLTLIKGGKRRYIGVHKAVCITFHGEQPDWADGVNHLDGIKTNNCAANLEWSSNVDNCRHAWVMGLSKGRKGTDHPKAVLNDDKVRAIRAYSDAVPLVELAKIYGVGPNQISSIRARRSWRHVA